MSQYLHPLSVPSRPMTCDESPFSSPQSPTSTSNASPTSRTGQSGQHFLNIPGAQGQQSIKDADGVDKLANAGVSQGRFQRKFNALLGWALIIKTQAPHCESEHIASYLRSSYHAMYITRIEPSTSSLYTCLLYCNPTSLI